ncbi:MAG: thioredoxin-disulfide reductase [Candidatus Babeliales bacterium]
MAKIHKLLIIGSGPAGLTAGIYSSRANLEPTIIEGTKPGGQLMGTTKVENWPGETSILGPQLMQNMREHAKKAGCTFQTGDIASVDFSQKPFTLTTNKNEQLQAHAVIIATGATPKRLGVPGEDQYWGKGVTTCTVCDGAFFQNQPVVIVGGGDSAMEGASFMLNFTKQITIIQIHDKLSASVAMQERVINNPNIKIIYQSSVTEIKGDAQKPTHVVVKNNKTGDTQELRTDAVFVSIGLTPNTQAFKDHIELLKSGHIKLFGKTKTSVEGVFAAGDVADYTYRQAITSAGDGCMAALDAERYLKSIGIE